MRRFALLFVALLASACTYAKANQQVLTTGDCGQSWKLVPTGNTVPMAVGFCSYNITIPDYPMQGESDFKASFSGRVLARVRVSYDYSITDGEKFVNEAKFLGRANTNADDADANNTALYENAENSVIDRRIREVASNLLVKEDIVEFSPAEFEERLLTSSNEMLAPRGVRLNMLTFVVEPQEQTALAIDVVTAMKVYDNKGLLDVGRQVMAARAGATKIELAPTPRAP